MTFATQRLFFPPQLLPYPYRIPIPILDEKLASPKNLDLYYSWEVREIENFIGRMKEESSSHFQVIKSFAERILRDSVDIDPSFAKVLNDRFWDLI